MILSPSVQKTGSTEEDMILVHGHLLIQLNRFQRYQRSSSARLASSAALSCSWLQYFGLRYQRNKQIDERHED